MKNLNHIFSLLAMSVWLSLVYTGCGSDPVLFTISYENGSFQLASNTGVAKLQPPMRGSCPLGKATRNGTTILWDYVDVMPGNCPPVQQISEVMPWRLSSSSVLSVFFEEPGTYKVVVVENGNIRDTRLFDGFNCENFLTYLDASDERNPVLYLGLEDGPVNVTHNPGTSTTAGKVVFERMNPTLSGAPERQREIKAGITYYLGACDLNLDGLKEVVITDGAGLIEVISNIHENPMLTALQDPGLLDFLNPDMGMQPSSMAAKSGPVDCLEESSTVTYATTPFWSAPMSNARFTIVCDQILRFNDTQQTADIDLNTVSLKITTSNNVVKVHKRN